MPVEKTNNYFPLLRFPAFQSTEQWKTKKLGDIAELYAGATPSTSVLEYWTEGTIPWMSSGEVHNGQIFETEKKITTLGYDRSSTKMVPANSVIVALAGQGKTRGSVAITRISLCTNQSLCSILPNETYDSDYLYFYLKSQYETLRFISSGDGTRGGLNLQMLRDFLIPFPSLEEQHIIALFLSSIDSFISSINEKVEQLKTHKKSLMQNLFPHKGQTVPEYRFPEFKGSKGWEGKRLGDIFKRITNKNITNNQNVLTISAQYGLVSQYDYFHKSVAASNLSNYYLLKKGDFAYNKSRSLGYPYGTIKPLRLYDEGVVSTLYICFRIKGCDIVDTFFEYYFETELINEEIGKIAQEGARNHGLLNISTDDFFNKVVLLVPSPSEQKTIAECLSSIDKTIRLYSEKASQLEQHKKGLMQQLFPKVKKLKK